MLCEFCIWLCTPWLLPVVNWITVFLQWFPTSLSIVLWPPWHHTPAAHRTFSLLEPFSVGYDVTNVQLRIKNDNYATFKDTSKMSFLLHSDYLNGIANWMVSYFLLISNWTFHLIKNGQWAYMMNAYKWGFPPERVRRSPAKLQLIGSERSNQAEDKPSKIHFIISTIYTAKYVQLQYIKVNLSPQKETVLVYI